MDARRSILVALVILFVFSVVLASRSTTDTAAERIYAMVAAALFGMPLLAILADTALKTRAPRDAGKLPAGNGDNRRETYRLSYPEGGRPTLHVPGLPKGPLEVLDVSEEGVRCRLPPGVSVSGTVEATLHFPSGRKADVHGVAVRREGSELALRLSRGVPSRLLIEEQLDQRKDRGETRPS